MSNQIEFSKCYLYLTANQHFDTKLLLSTKRNYWATSTEMLQDNINLSLSLLLKNGFTK